MENTISDAIIVSSNKAAKRFPACLLDADNYTAGKAIVAVMFLFSCMYFLSGLYHFICWESGWFLLELLTKPFYLLYHIGVFTIMYSITWATFDIETFKACAKKFFGVVAAIVYVCLPADLVPDFLPFVGQIDDMIAVAFGIYSAVTMGKPYVKQQTK